MIGERNDGYVFCFCDFDRIQHVLGLARRGDCHYQRIGVQQRGGDRCGQHVADEYGGNAQGQQLIVKVGSHHRRAVNPVDLHFFCFQNAIGGTGKDLLVVDRLGVAQSGKGAVGGFAEDLLDAVSLLCRADVGVVFIFRKAGGNLQLEHGKSASRKFVGKVDDASLGDACRLGKLGHGVRNEFLGSRQNGVGNFTLRWAEMLQSGSKLV